MRIKNNKNNSNIHLGIYIWEDVHDIFLSEKKNTQKSYHGEIYLHVYMSMCRERCGGDCEVSVKQEL